MTQPEPEPRVAGAVIANLRELLIERGSWHPLRHAADEIAQERLLVLDRAHGSQWVELDAYMALLQALEERDAPERIYELGVDWMDRALERGFLSNMIRSWLRAFTRTRENVTLLVPHLWQVVHRDSGKMRVHAQGADFVTMRVRPVPEVMRLRTGWHRLLEGVGDQLFRIAEVDGAVQIGPSASQGEAIDFLVIRATR